MADIPKDLLPSDSASLEALKESMKRKVDEYFNRLLGNA
jgi:hypothetical protein